MNPIAFVVMFLAYSIVEYVFREKLNLLYRSLLLVCLVFVGLCYYRVNVDGWFIMPVWNGALYFLVSFVYDRLKIDSRGYEFRNFAFYFIVQVIGIYLVSTTFGGITYPVYSPFYKEPDLHFLLGTIVLVSVFVANIWMAPKLIRCILHDLVYQTNKAREVQLLPKPDEVEQLVDKGAYHAGTVIGILERLLIITSILYTGGNPSVNISLIGFILGTKSLARFKKFGDDEFVEYFIVGTLTSVFFALLSLLPLRLL